MTQVFREKSYDFVKFRVPGQEVGQPFDTSILDEPQHGIDRKT